MWFTEIENKYSAKTLALFTEFAKGKAELADETFGGDLYYSERTIKTFENDFNISNSERLFPK